MLYYIDIMDMPAKLHFQASYTFKLYFHATLSSYYVMEFKYSNHKSISVVLLNTHKIKDLFLIIVFLTE